MRAPSRRPVKFYLVISKHQEQRRCDYGCGRYGLFFFPGRGLRLCGACAVERFGAIKVQGIRRRGFEGKTEAERD